MERKTGEELYFRKHKLVDIFRVKTISDIAERANTQEYFNLYLREATGSGTSRERNQVCGSGSGHLGALLLHSVDVSV